MAKPRLGWYTAGQLAKEWEKHGIGKEEIDHYLENGQLKRSKRFASRTTDKDVFLEAPPFSWTEDDEDLRLLNGHHDLYVVFDNLERPDYIMLAEVERFEKEHGLVVYGNVVKPVEEHQVDVVTDPDKIGASQICEACGYGVNSFSAVKRHAEELGIEIRHVNGPYSEPVLKTSETNLILARKLAREKKRRKKVMTKQK
jgi:hypothetical protein